MNLLKKILDYYIFSNIHVSIAGFCLTKVTLLQHHINSNVSPIFIGLSIFISYNLIRFYELKSIRLKWFKSWFNAHKKGLLFLVIIAIVGNLYIIFGAKFNFKSLIIVFPFAFMTFFYAIPLFKIKGAVFSFRNTPGIKIFSIAIAWAGLMVLFPLKEAGQNFTSTIYLEFIQRILFVFVITLPFDIRDINLDVKKLKTIPQVFGIQRTKQIGYFSLILFLVIEFFNSDFYTVKLIVNVFIAVMSGIFLYFSNVKKSRYYASFWVESIPVMWLGLLILLN